MPFSESAWRLIYALRTDAFDAAEATLIEFPTVLEEQDGVGETPLHWLSIESEMAAVEFLIRHGANVNTRDRSNATPLLSVAVLGYSELGKLLLCSGADPNVLSTTRGTALHVAVERWEPTEFIELLINAGADATICDPTYGTPLHAAVREGNVAAVRALLACGVSPVVRDEFGNTPLHAAADFSGTEVGREEPGVREIAAPMPPGERAWYFEKRRQAATREIVNLLLAAGAEINATDNLGATPLHEAEAGGHAWLVDLLIAAGADTSLERRF